MTPKLLIFDCDGVLVDSEAISVSILVDLIAKAGGSITEADAYRHFLGKSMASVRAILASDFGLDLLNGELAGMRAEIWRRFSAELRPIPGIREALEKLTQRRCVASSGSMDRIRLSLGVTGLLEMLEPHLYSATMVARGKPAPDLFLHAANAMGVAAVDCVVIEDSPAGIDAAHAAGMRVFAFTGGSHAGHASIVEALATRRPDRVFSDMRLLPALVAGLGARAS